MGVIESEAIIKLKELFNKGDYDKIDDFMEEKIDAEKLLMQFAYETENISVVNYVMNRAIVSNDDYWIELVIKLFLNPYSYIEGAYSCALYYAKKQLKNNYTEKNLEQILFFNVIPEKLISDMEAKKIIHELLKINPKNETALFHLRKHIK